MADGLLAVPAGSADTRSIRLWQVGPTPPKGEAVDLLEMLGRSSSPAILLAGLALLVGGAALAFTVAVQTVPVAWALPVVGMAAGRITGGGAFVGLHHSLERHASRLAGDVDDRVVAHDGRGHRDAGARRLRPGDRRDLGRSPDGGPRRVGSGPHRVASRRAATGPTPVAGARPTPVTARGLPPGPSPPPPDPRAPVEQVRVLRHAVVADGRLQALDAVRQCSLRPQRWCSSPVESAEGRCPVRTGHGPACQR